MLLPDDVPLLCEPLDWPLELPDELDEPELELELDFDVLLCVEARGSTYCWSPAEVASAAAGPVRAIATTSATQPGT